MTVSTPARPLRPGSRRLGRLGAAVVAAATLALGGTAAGCSETEDKGGTTAAQADRVGVSDVWVKSARSGMTAAFGTLVNEGGAEVRLESVTTEPIHEATATSYVAVWANASAANRARCARVKPPARTAAGASS